MPRKCLCYSVINSFHVLPNTELITHSSVGRCALPASENKPQQISSSLLLVGPPRGRIRVPVGARFFFPTSSRRIREPTHPPIQWVPGALSPRVKRPGREADYSPPTTAKVKNIWLYRVSQEEMLIFWEVIVWVILNKKLYIYMCPIPNGFRDRAISLYTVQTSNTPCPHTSCKVH
jgi:hypothetical protein